jgi:hypothetical protein
MAACNKADRARPASEDPEKQLYGEAWLPAYESGAPPKEAILIVAGPAFVTDFILNGDDARLFLSKDAACKERLFEVLAWPHATENLTASRVFGGLRFFVPANQALCGQSVGSARLVWTGFKP